MVQTLPGNTYTGRFQIKLNTLLSSVGQLKVGSTYRLFVDYPLTEGNTIFPSSTPYEASVSA